MLGRHLNINGYLFSATAAKAEALIAALIAAAEPYQ